jgi:hypothetical protein
MRLKWFASRQQAKKGKHGPWYGRPLHATQGRQHHTIGKPPRFTELAAETDLPVASF